MDFEYDPGKDRANRKKHGISFEEAITVFSDPLLLILENYTEASEDRFIAAGLSEKERLLLVVHCIRESNDEEEIIRIISARRAGKKEKKKLEEKRSR